MPSRSEDWNQPRLLVRTLQIEVGRPGQAARFEGEGVRRAAFEPDIDDVAHLLVGAGVVFVAEEAGGRRGEPGISAFRGKGGLYAGDHRGVAQDFARALLDEDRDGHAPGALPADAPVGAVGDHAGETLAALFWNEAGVCDGL